MKKRVNLKDYSVNAVAALVRKAMHCVPGVKSVSHITPRAYCVAKPAVCCAVFAVPRCDKEPQVINDEFTVVQNESASAVKMGQWCSLAYINTRTIGEPRVIEVHDK